MILNNQWVTEEVKNYKKLLKANENRNTIFQNLCEAAKPVLGGKITGIQAYFKKQINKIFQINSLTLYLKELEI